MLLHSVLKELQALLCVSIGGLKVLITLRFQRNSACITVVFQDLNAFGNLDLASTQCPAKAILKIFGMNMYHAIYHRFQNRNFVFFTSAASCNTLKVVTVRFDIGCSVYIAAIIVDAQPGEFVRDISFFNPAPVRENVPWGSIAIATLQRSAVSTSLDIRST